MDEGSVRCCRSAENEGPPCSRTPRSGWGSWAGVLRAKVVRWRRK